MGKYAEFKAELQKLDAFEAAIAKAAESIDVWRAFNPVVPLLFDALREEAKGLRASAKGLEKALAKFDNVTGAGPELGEALKDFVTRMGRAKKIHEAYEREGAIATKENAWLSGGEKT